MGNVLGIAGGDVDHDSTPPLRLRPHEADHGDFRLGMIKKGEWSMLSVLVFHSLMPRNYTAEAHDKFPLPPRPDELDYSTKRELKMAEDAYSAARDRIAAEWDRWVEREKVRDLEREEAIRRAELERKRKEEEEQAERLEAAARKKANAVAQALLAGRKGCDLCL